MPSLRKKAWPGCRVLLVVFVPAVVLLVAARPIGALKDHLPASVGVYGDLIFGFGILAAMSFALQRWTRCAPKLRWLPFAYAGIVVFGQIGVADAHDRYQRFRNGEPAIRFQLTPDAVDILLVEPPASEIRVSRPAPELPDTSPDARGWDVRFSVASASADSLGRSLKVHLLRRSREAAVNALTGALGPLAGRNTPLADWLVGWSGWRPRATHAVVLNVDGIQMRTPVGRRKSRPADWEAAIGGTTLTPPIYAILGEGSPARLQEWKTWAEETGGDAIRFKDAGRILLVDAALRIATERSAEFAYPALARHYRPKLLFDTDERYPNPLDVERFLASPKVRVCGKIGGSESCSAFARWIGPDPLHEYLSFKPKDFRGKSEPSAIYYHVVEGPDDRVYLDYWWYFAYNPTPVAQSVFCQTGFNASGVTCFNHASDWEGLTVVLGKKGSALVPESVIYAQHEFGVAYEWGDLQKQGSLQGDRPIVFVAQGSHASYPTRCLAKCEQTHDPGYRKEGRHDGHGSWLKNDERACMNACLKRLPQTRDGLPALWNASPRPWGKRTCAFGTSSCDGVVSPRAPSFQARFSAPWMPLDGREKALGPVKVRYSTYG